VNATTPLAAEKQLVKYLPEEVIHKAHHWLILHGRYVCTARSPKCASCEISTWCKHLSSKKKKADT
jgi:endonuclease-3